MPKVIIKCESVNNVKPTITAEPAKGGPDLNSETIDDLVSSNSVTILMGEEVNTPQKFFAAVRDMADRYIGELRFKRDEKVTNLDAGPVAVTSPAPFTLTAEVTSEVGSVQWFKDGSILAGETAVALTVDPSAIIDSGDYFLRGTVTATGEEIDSAVSVVTVT